MDTRIVSVGGVPEEVGTGEVRVASSGVLRASALGSCVAVALVDPVAGVGGVAHVMLPGSGSGPPSSENGETRPPDHRYAEDAILELDRSLAALGGQRSRSTAILVGGANVLGRAGADVGSLVLASVREVLDMVCIQVGTTHVGGAERRSLTVQTNPCRVLFTVGDSQPAVLWEPGS